MEFQALNFDTQPFVKGDIIIPKRDNKIQFAFTDVSKIIRAEVTKLEKGNLAIVRIVRCKERVHLCKDGILNSIEAKNMSKDYGIGDEILVNLSSFKLISSNRLEYEISLDIMFLKKLKQKNNSI